MMYIQKVVLRLRIAIFVVCCGLHVIAFSQGANHSSDITHKQIASNSSTTKLTKQRQLNRYNISDTTNTQGHITSFADVIEPLMPTVVNIYTEQYTNYNKSNHFSFVDIIPFEQLNNFLQQFNAASESQESYTIPTTMSLGSGFIIDADGYILTNHHVIDSSDAIYIKLSNNIELPAKIVGADPKTDIALLKIEHDTALPFITFGDSNKVRIGDVVIAIGNPLGFGGTVTTGIISSKGRDLGINPDELVDDFLQTDAAINIGNSGGPLYNMAGQVIGVNTAIPNIGNGTNIGIGFAIPSNVAQYIATQLKEKGKIIRGRLDISIQAITKELIDALSLKQDYGVLVVDVKPGGSGAVAGLIPGDLIIEFNKEKILTVRKLQLLVADSKMHDKITLTVVRDNQIITLSTTLSEVTTHDNLDVHNTIHILQKSGVRFVNTSTYLLNKFGIEHNNKGVLVIDFVQHNITLDLRVGDLIIAVNNHYINNINDLELMYNQIQQNGKNNAVLLVKRQELTLFVTLPIQQDVPKLPNVDTHNTANPIK